VLNVSNPSKGTIKAEKYLNFAILFKIN